MGHVIAIFGTLIALNLGFGYWLSEESQEAQPPEGVVEVESVELTVDPDVDQADGE